MKKIAQLLLLLGLVVSFTSCLSMGFDELDEPILENKYKYPSDFVGPMNPFLGYETITWGDSYKSVKEKFKVTDKIDGNFFVVYIGPSLEYSLAKFGHGEVDETKMYFAYDRLYCVEDTYYLTPSLLFLRSRYGNFSEKTISETKKEQGVIAYYTNYDYAGEDGASSMNICIYSDGKTIVSVYDYYVRCSNNYPSVEILDKNYANTDVLERVIPNQWFGYAAYDLKNKKINFTFLNQNEDGKYLFVGYSKSLESPILSYVRSGICWRNYTSGTYEIKIGYDISERKYSSSDWKSLYNGVEYTYTYNSGESARSTLDLFLANEEFTLRHNGDTSKFVCNGEQFYEVLDFFNISWDEFDAAIANEEF